MPNMTSRRPTSPPSASSSRTPSVRSQPTPAQQHAPLNPSNLREAHTLSISPEDRRAAETDTAPSSSEPSPHTHPTHLDTDPSAEGDAVDGGTKGESSFGKAITETTALLRKPFELIEHAAHPGPCNHGTFSPRLESRAESIRSNYGFGGAAPGYGTSDEAEGSESMFGSFLKSVGLTNRSARKKKMSTTNWLAERHGITNTTTM